MPGEEARVSNVCRCSWSNTTWVCAHLRFIVDPVSLLLNATAAGNKMSKHLEAA